LRQLEAWISESEAEHQRSWSENQANTLSYMFFGFPTDWNGVKYPIDQNYMNAVIKADFIKNTPGF